MILVPAWCFIVVIVAYLYHRQIGKWAINDQILYLSLHPMCWAKRVAFSVTILAASILMLTELREFGMSVIVLSLIGGCVGFTNIIVAVQLRSIDLTLYERYHRALTRLRSQLPHVNRSNNASPAQEYTVTVANGRLVEVAHESMALTIDLGSVMVVWRANGQELRKPINIALAVCSDWIESIFPQLPSPDPNQRRVSY